MTTRRQFGMTLIELMIVVAVVAILAAIAFPSYTEHVQRSRRTDAKSALLAAAQAMERYYTEQNTYLGATLPGVYPDASPEGFYNLQFTAQTASAFTITATPTGAQAADTKCGNFTYTNAGARGVSGTLSVAECWNR